MQDATDVSEAFEKFFQGERKRAFEKFCNEENIDAEKFQKILNSYLYTGKKPLRQDIVDTLTEKPKLTERTTIIGRITSKMMKFVEMFEEV